MAPPPLGAPCAPFAARARGTGVDRRRGAPRLLLVPPRVTVNVSALVDLPSVLQSLAGTRRSAVLRVEGEGLTRWVHLAAGQVVAIGGAEFATFARALVWSRLAARNEVEAALAVLGSQATPEALWQRVRDDTGLPSGAVIEPLALLVEHEMDAILGWAAPQFGIVEEAPPDLLADFQRRAGLALSVPALLLEALRRQDERAQHRDLIPDPWDVLLADGAAAVADEDQQALLAQARQPQPFETLLAWLPLPPWRALRATAALRRAGLLRLATAAELAQLGERAWLQGRLEQAHGLWRRAVALGHDGWRIRLQLADLAERQGRREEAAAHCLAAAQHASAPAEQVAQLERALALGAAPDAALGQLVSLYLVLGEDGKALAALLDLVRWHEQRGELARALEVLSEAREMGADAVVTGLATARLAAALGEKARAAIHYEQAARLAASQGRQAEAVQGWQALLELQPERLDAARALAERLAEGGQRDRAVAVLRQALAAAAQAPEDARLAAWELVAQLAPDDAEAHDWLARTYARRRDRDRATQQLRLVAKRQEEAGDDAGLVATLERIIVLGGEDVEVLRRLASAQDRLGHLESALDAWCRATDLAADTGQTAAARAIVEQALTRAPFSAALRARAADLALRSGAPAEAVAELRRAADLALGSGDAASAKELLTRLVALAPEDMLARCRLAELLHETGDAEAAAAVEEALHLATRRADWGLAVELARRRVALAPPPARFEARAALVGLLRRAGDAAGERAAARELLNDLLAAGELERAVALLSELVAAHPRDPEYALQLGEAAAGLGDRRTAARCYRHAVGLLQAEGRLDEARAALEQLAAESDDPLLIAAARRCLAAGEPIEWERLREQLVHDQRRGLVDRLGAAADAQR